MKKFKDPKWDSYNKCYEEMLKYRLARRLLEHSHNPWFWGGSDTDSDSGGRSPTPAGKNQIKENSTKDRNNTEEVLEECSAVRVDKLKEQQDDPRELVPRLVLSEDENTGQGDKQSAGEEQKKGNDVLQQLPVLQVKHAQESEGPQSQQNKTSKQNRVLRLKPVHQSNEDRKQIRHPFVLYASGEKDSDIASRKTHNVRPVASTQEIHASALRAKTRRDVERQLQSQRAERRRAKSADVDKARLKLVAPEFNPWLTEYMRCFSARSR